MRPQFLLLALISAMLLSFGIVRGEPQDSGEMAAEWADVDAQTCADCHEDQLVKLQHGPHATLDMDEALADHLGVASSCTACHGDPTTHLDEGGGEGTIFAFKDDDPANAKSMTCLNCHADAHPRFLATRHAMAGLDCTSCHGIHDNDGDSMALLKETDVLHDPDVDPSAVVCQSCHGEVFAAFEFNERHRLQEGILSCLDCHNPHEPQTRMRLGGFKQQQCGECHTDKTGPFIFEHGSARVEGCVACHDPHGSPNRHLLNFQSVADLCYSCHVVVPGFHTRFTNETVCTNCHSTIHGSNFDPFFLK